MAFHKRLAMALAADDRLQQEIAKKAGVTASQLSRWKGGVTPQPEVIGKLIEVLNVNGHWLLTGEGQMKLPARSEEYAVRLEVIGRIADGEVQLGQLLGLTDPPVEDADRIAEDGAGLFPPKPQHPRKQEGG